jgi:hypothetical protein
MLKAGDERDIRELFTRVSLGITAVLVTVRAFIKALVWSSECAARVNAAIIQYWVDSREEGNASLSRVKRVNLDLRESIGQLFKVICAKPSLELKCIGTCCAEIS